MTINIPNHGHSAATANIADAAGNLHACDADDTHKLVIAHISKSFDERTVLDDISFNVEKGEFLSILGPSGCGKTTILRILIGLLQPDKGSILMDGIDITHAAASERRMGIVFQNYALFENMTVLRNVEYALLQRKDLRSDANAIAMEMVSLVGLEEHASMRPGALSGGQQQRVAIARTLALKPDVILFDEPMSALDVATRLSLREEIKRIQAKFGITMIYITHDQEEAFAMSDRIMVMEDAHIHQIDTPEEIMLHPADDYVRSFVIDNLQTKIDSLAKYMRLSV